jgi:hypothetical protein
MATLLRNQMVQAPSLKKSFGTGWSALVYGRRDFTDAHAELVSSIRELGTPKATVPARANLRQHCSRIENQGSLRSCTANAAVGFVAY